MKRFDGLLPVFQMSNDKPEADLLKAEPAIGSFKTQFENVAPLQFSYSSDDPHPDQGASEVYNIFENEPVRPEPVLEIATPEQVDTQAADIGQAPVEIQPETPGEQQVVMPAEPDVQKVTPENSDAIGRIGKPIQYTKEVIDQAPSPDKLPEANVADDGSGGNNSDENQEKVAKEFTPTTGEEFLGIPILMVEDLPPEAEEEPADSFMDCFL